jgi:GNAT superfamily N-acetyltransferase
VDLTVESLRAGDEVHRHALVRQAFNATHAFDPDLPDLDPDRVVCTYDGERLLGTVLTFDFAQTWGGRAVPCGGVSGVAVAPETRGRGAARRMLDESFTRMGRRGEVVACLFPTASALYRGLGFEVVGFHERRSIPLGAIRADDGGLVWRRVRADDPVRAGLHDRVARCTTAGSGATGAGGRTGACARSASSR